MLRVIGETYKREGIGNLDICASDKCPGDCRCRCHGQLSSFVPRWLRPAVGNVFIHHYWLSVFASDRMTCSDRRCRRDRSNLLRIKYWCPNWFAQISVELQTQCIPVHFCIQTPRVVPSLRYLNSISCHEFLIKLSTRELTLCDVEPNGFSVLHVSLRLSHTARIPAN